LGVEQTSIAVLPTCEARSFPGIIAGKGSAGGSVTYAAVDLCVPVG
jgi:hypothetical protein